jgi:hypothetical protein
MAVVVFAGLVAVCGFFLHLLVQFRRDEKHPRRHEESPTGFPIVASGQIVGPLPDPNGPRLRTTTLQRSPGGSSERRDIS